MSSPYFDNGVAQLYQADARAATVLDPFVGSGTTAAVAQRLGRRAVGVDLSADYLELATKRLSAVPLPMNLMHDKIHEEVQLLTQTLVRPG